VVHLRRALPIVPEGVQVVVDDGACGAGSTTVNSVLIAVLQTIITRWAYTLPLRVVRVLASFDVHGRGPTPRAPRPQQRGLARGRALGRGDLILAREGRAAAPITVLVGQRGST